MAKFRAVYAAVKSYILRHDASTGKWPLYVCVSEKMTPDHEGLIETMFAEIVARGLSKEQALELRQKHLDANSVD